MGTRQVFGVEGMKLVFKSAQGDVKCSLLIRGHGSKANFGDCNVTSGEDILAFELQLEAVRQGG